MRPWKLNSSRGLSGVLLGALWLILSVSKWASPSDFVAYVGRGLNANGQAVAQALISLEALLALSLVILAPLSPTGAGPQHRMLRACLAISILMTLASTASILLGPKDLTCGCFGSSIEATMGRRLVVIGALLALSGFAWPTPMREQ